MESKIALIVEDNIFLANLFSRALKDVDYHTLIINDGRKAEEWMSHSVPDLLLLDMHLPYVSGQQLLEKISADERYRDVYIVIVTADARMGSMVADQASFLLVKPVDIRQLQQLALRLKQPV